MQISRTPSREDSLSYGVDLPMIQVLNVIDEEGLEVPVESLWADCDHCILVLLRNFLCYVYHDYVVDLCRIDPVELAANRTRLVLIGCCDHKFIDSFRRRTGYMGELYVDPQRKLYDALGCNRKPVLVRDSAREKREGIHAHSSVLWGFWKSLWRSLEFREWQGDIDQQGGAVVLSSDPVMAIPQFSFWHFDRNPLDHAPINDLLATANMPPLNFANDRRVLSV